MGTMLPTWMHSSEADRLDRRTRKTRAALYEALIVLLREKPLRDISVTELTSAADVNRSTFYTHFQDIFDLYEKLQDDFKACLQELAEREVDDLRRANYRPLLTNFFSYIRENREVFQVVFGEEFGDAIELVRSCILEALRDRTTVEGRCVDDAAWRKFSYQVEFAARGAVSVARKWILEGCVESVDDMVDLLSEMFGEIWGVEGEGHA